MLRFPLTTLLGSEGNVRVLRELFDHGGELSVSVIAARARLSRQHVHRVLSALVEMNVVEPVGVGGYPAYRVRRAHPLHDHLEEIFRAEKGRYDAVLRAIRTAAESVPHVSAAWLYGSVARGEDASRSDVDVALVVNDPEIDHATDAVRDLLRPSEETLGVNISVVGIGPEDVLRLGSRDAWWLGVVQDAIPLLGPDPERLAKRVRGETARPCPEET